MSPITSPFSDTTSVSGYAERTTRIVPGLKDLHRMTGLLLAERAAEDAHILVLGAGGGMELSTLTQMQPDWRFLGVDPSAQMLELARAALGSRVSRVELHEGYIHDAPNGPFDGAVCLLTLHFLNAEERRQTIAAVHGRLKPNAPFVVAHHSFPRGGDDEDKWLRRNGAFAADSGMPALQTEASIRAMKEHLPALSPEEDVALLRSCGFAGIELFYAAFTFKGWVAYRN